MVRCEIDNTQCEKDIKCLSLKFKRLIYAISKCGEKFSKSETLIKRDFSGLASGKNGTVNLDMVLQVEKDDKRFFKSLPADYVNLPIKDELNTFRQLTVPTLMG